LSGTLTPNRTSAQEQAFAYSHHRPVAGRWQRLSLSWNAAWGSKFTGSIQGEAFSVTDIQAGHGHSTSLAMMSQPVSVSEQWAGYFMMGARTAPGR